MVLNSRSKLALTKYKTNNLVKILKKAMWRPVLLSFAFVFKDDIEEEQINEKPFIFNKFK